MNLLPVLFIDRILKCQKKKKKINPLLKSLNNSKAYDISNLEMTPSWKYHLKISAGESMKLICVEEGGQRHNTSKELNILP